MGNYYLTTLNMLKKMKELVAKLDDVHDLKLANGHYPTCRDTRAILKEIKDEAHSLRKNIAAAYKVRASSSKEAIAKMKQDEKAYIKETIIKEDIPSEPTQDMTDEEVAEVFPKLD